MMDDTQPSANSEGAPQEQPRSEKPPRARGRAAKKSRREFLTDVAAIGVGLAALSTVVSHPASEALAASQGDLRSGVHPTPEEMSITLRINGREYPMTVEPRVTLLDAIRERAG